MSRYEEYANSLILSEYVLSLTGDPEYAENLEANRSALSALVADNAADIAFMSSVVDSLYKACEGKHDDRNAVCDAFLSECELLGIAQAGFIMDMADAIYEMATSEKHDLYDGLTEEPASDFLRGVVINKKEGKPREDHSENQNPASGQLVHGAAGIRIQRLAQSRAGGRAAQDR